MIFIYNHIIFKAAFKSDSVAFFRFLLDLLFYAPYPFKTLLILDL